VRYYVSHFGIRPHFSFYKAASKDENISKALSNYPSAAFIGDMITNPEAEALDKFAEVIERIEADAKAA